MVQTGHSGESRARSEALALSINFNMFWMPDQGRHDDLGTFYETITVQCSALGISNFGHWDLFGI